MTDSNRLTAIDCLRGFAILWVLAYHFVSLPIFKHGTYGVLLFFVISGYCISISAETSSSAWHFYAKRLGRLLPALVVCSMATTALKHFTPGMIATDRLVSWRDMLYGWFALPSLNFLQIGYSLPDGAYWSLDVEFHFYVLIFAVLLLGLRNHILLVVCGYTVVEVYFLKSHQTNLVFYPFFIVGLAVVALCARRTLLAFSGIAFAILLDLYFLLKGFSQSSVPVELSRSVMLWISIVAMIAAAKTKLPGGAVRALKPLAYVGLISYPLYLIHQDVGYIFFRWLGVPYSDTLYPRLLRLILGPALFIPIAGLIHTYVERPLIDSLTRLLSRRSPIAATIPIAAE